MPGMEAGDTTIWSFALQNSEDVHPLGGPAWMPAGMILEFL
jgi:hypothetical protein